MKPWALIPAPIAHDWAPFFLSLFGNASRLIGGTRHIPQWNSVRYRGLHFPNPVGLAAGVDKDARNLCAWWSLGAGFLEVGTITPHAQKANPGVIISRDFGRQALWNRLGFPNQGQRIVADRLQNLQTRFPTGWPTPVFVNIGKNRTTLNSEAWKDYVGLIETFYALADALVINISSPNTTGLRELLEPQNLKSFLTPIVAKRDACAALRNSSTARNSERNDTLQAKPLLLKLSPDMSESQMKCAIQVSGTAGVDGWILTNTTLSRDAHSPFPTDGGLSGAPVAELSEQALRWAVQEIGLNTVQRPQGFRPLLISAGGILSPGDVQRRLELGADLVQIYSALILKGPQFFRDCRNYFGRAAQGQA